MVKNPKARKMLKQLRLDTEKWFKKMDKETRSSKKITTKIKSCKKKPACRRKLTRLMKEKA